MTITIDPIRLDTVVVPDDLSEILAANHYTPDFNAVLAAHADTITDLIVTVWPVATVAEPDAVPEPNATPEPETAPEDVPEPHPGVEPDETPEAADPTLVEVD